MSEKDSGILIHPATQQILNLKSAVEAYMLDKQFLKAFEAMNYLIGSMAPEDKLIMVVYKSGTSKPLLEVIRDEERRHREIKGLKQLARRISNKRYTYRSWLDMIMNQLHTKGYLSGEKFGFRDLTGGKTRR